MNQKDYKAIGEIIKCDLPDKEDVDKEIKAFFVDKLADYFEKEDNLRALPNGIQSSDLKFNREQFLKDCGVK